MRRGYQNNFWLEKVYFLYIRQKSPLLKYGDELSLLYATYKTTRYALPLFYLVVKTSLIYQVVATFVTKSKSTESISERVIKQRKKVI